ncbi:trimeric intracellular cation channel family protein [Xylanibacter muris]|uniref:Trimeric intracellular cation channel family protein n=1 Tax=Xylanibacter muris TaxID=2736290 RepID=A0ABX2AME2_9BACT|nr:trimeric intracellular cation channel family protein [Xylanibacter muris]NPD91422.1 trimeric intracellular cation channel family protein [Xylanibacter muris]
MAEEISVSTVQQVIEFLGTFAFAISGIRHAAAKHFDWFGGYVCGIAVAIGGGTIRDVMLGAIPFWMTTPVYMICTAMALLVVIVFSKYMERLSNTWFVFDTLGLALFTIAGIQKSLDYSQPFWVAITMGCITGAAGGVIRDILLNNEPVIFRKEIYAMACFLGGSVYWLLAYLSMPVEITVIVSFTVTCLIRFLAVKYHLSLPVLKGIDNDDSK